MSERDCNTCRHHRQAKLPGVGPLGLDLPAHFRCADCLLALALSGELSQWEPEPPQENLEA